MVIGDAKVFADLLFLDRLGVDDDDDLGFVLHLKEEVQFGVGLKAREDAGGMEVIEELAAELEIELAAELVDPFADAFALKLDVLLIIETDLVHKGASQNITLSIISGFSLRVHEEYGP